MSGLPSSGGSGVCVCKLSRRDETEQTRRDDTNERGERTRRYEKEGAGLGDGQQHTGSVCGQAG